MKFLLTNNPNGFRLLFVWPLGAPPVLAWHIQPSNSGSMESSASSLSWCFVFKTKLLEMHFLVGSRLGSYSLFAFCSHVVVLPVISSSCCFQDSPLFVPQAIYIMPWYAALPSLTRGLLSFLGVWICIFHYAWNLLSHCSFESLSHSLFFFAPGIPRSALLSGHWCSS